jgi:hypothetical protein
MAVQQPGYAITPTPKEPHVSYVSVGTELRPRCLGRHFMKPRNHDKITLCKILHFVGGMGLLSEWKRW